MNVRIVMAGEAPIQGWYFPDFGIARPGATILFDYQISEGRKFGYRIKPVLSE
jgi:hypothetical protein